ncbi:MAG: bifunctional oligoribonuclease/PAP phosphatase NrnA ['Brassica napus' phytoplasma]|nr:MAG: bifunctional oligoribonuclease/PAP phosphatase NrnA ['Brassica napus' phytoplasma]
MKFIETQIKTFDTIIIHGHKNPDGDCYGSQLGLKNMIQNTFPHKNVYVVGQTKNHLTLLGQMDEIPDETYQNALVIVVDCGTTQAISDQRFKLGKVVIRIDHHILIENYGNYQWVDDSFGSCSEMIYLLKEKLNLNLTFKGALAIYVGLITDTGNFRYHRVSAQTLRIASELLNYGIDVALVEQNINKVTLNFLKYQGYICQNIIACDGFAYVYVNQQIIEQFNITLEEVFLSINILSNIKNFPFYALFFERPDSKIQVRICSNGPQIYHIVQKYGCKGHLRACSMFLPSEKEILPFVATIKKEIAPFFKTT